MEKKVINKTEICELSKLLSSCIGVCANKVKYECENCQDDGCCMMMEIACQVYAMGYAKTESPVKKDAKAVEEMAKEIARARGYGCDERDSCAKCNCAMLGCIPLQLARCLAKTGYKKKEG